MIGFVKDDGGRAAAGFKGRTGDCVTRATAIISGLPYKDIYTMMAEANATSKQAAKKGKAQKTARNGIYRKDYEKVFSTIGLTKVKLPQGPRPTYSEAYEAYGDCIVTTRGHMAAIKDGNLRDTFDGRTYIMVDKQGWEEEYERKAMAVFIKPFTLHLRASTRDGETQALCGAGMQTQKAIGAAISRGQELDLCKPCHELR